MKHIIKRKLRMIVNQQNLKKCPRRVVNFPLTIILIPQTQKDSLIRLTLKISTQIVFLKALQETPGPPHIVNLYTVQTANILIIPAY